MDIIDRTLAFAKREDMARGSSFIKVKGISQRRVHVRGIAGDKITVYCTQKKQFVFSTGRGYCLRCSRMSKD